MMDTFYEENQENNIKMLKNKMTLDFNSPASHSKKVKLMKTCVLESPDLKMLKLASPELERMIIQQNGMVTTTPTPSCGAQSILPYFLKTELNEPTEEQELYARGFVDALNQLHQTNGQQNQNHCLTNNNNHNSNNNNNNNNNNNQSNSHLNSNSNQNTLNTSSDSSCDLTIADTNSNNKTNNRRNSYHILVPPPPTTVSILTNTTADITDTKFAVPQIPSTHVPTTVSSVATSGVSGGTEQYVSVSSCQTNGSHVLINQSVNNHNSVLPPYSQAVNNNNNNNTNNNNCEKIDRTYSAQPIDMEDQERIKLERKRLRNRIAASKCRRRKLERISKLEDKVKGLKGENSELSIVINKLRDQVCSLKQQVMEHVKCGCQLMVCQ